MSIDCFNISEEELNRMIQGMKKIDKNVLDLSKKFIGETILGIDSDTATIEDQTSDGNPEIRVEFIVCF